MLAATGRSISSGEPRKDTPMAKGQKKSNKETRKPKAEKAKPPVSVSRFSLTPPDKKK
jgi:hypothetical protein